MYANFILSQSRSLGAIVLNNMRKFAILLIMFAFLPSVSLAENILYIVGTVYPNDSVEINQLNIVPGIPTRYILPGNYRIDLRSEGGQLIASRNISVKFFLYADPPIPVNQSIVMMRVPYNPKMKTLEVYHGENKIYSLDIELCNYDSLCQSLQENLISCPSDCPPNQKDGLCLNRPDGLCDPDCFEGVDPDCNKAPDNARSNKPPISAYIVLGTTAIIAGILIIWNIRKLKRYKTQKVRN
jgi:hypothetical protein